MKPYAVRLKEIIRPAKSVRAANGIYPILSMTMHQGLVDQATKFKKRIASVDTSQYKVVKWDQLVVSFPIDEGVLAFQRKYSEAIVSPAYDIWDICAPTVVHAPYVERVLRSPYALQFYKSKLRGTTARRRTLPVDVFLGMEIPLPPLEEQRRIADILDKAEELRKKRQRTIELLEELQTAVFLGKLPDPSIAGGTVMRLADVCDKITDGAHLTPTYVEDGVPFLRVTDIQSAAIDWSRVKRIPLQEHVALTARCKPEPGDVLYSKNGTIGIAKYINWQQEFSIFVSLCLLKPKPGVILGEYLESFLQSDLALKQARAHSKTGTVTNLHLVDIREIKIPTPPIRVQSEWVAIKNSFQATREQLSASLSALDELIHSLHDTFFMN